MCFDRFTDFFTNACFRVIVVLLLHALNLAFAKIPIGGHTVCACVAGSVVYMCVSVSLRSIFETIIPFEVVFVSILSLPLGDILYGMIKFIPVKNSRTGQTKRWAIGALEFSQCLCVAHQYLFPNQTHTNNRNLASHARVTSIRSQSKSRCEAWYSDYVRFQVCVSLSFSNLTSFIFKQAIGLSILLGISHPRWSLLSIRNLHSSTSDSRVFPRSSRI